MSTGWFYMLKVVEVKTLGHPLSELAAEALLDRLVNTLRD